jgi:hypothetical protein
MKPVIFFSYSRQDADFVLQLGKDLRNAGVDIWLDQLDIKPGERWDVAIQESLSECGQLLVVLSPASVASANVLDEVSFALEQGKPVIPVLIADCEIPFRLRRLQHVDFRPDYATALKHVLDSLAVPLAPGARTATAAPVTREANTRAPSRSALIGGVAGAALAALVAIVLVQRANSGGQNQVNENAATSATATTPASAAAAAATSTSTSASTATSTSTKPKTRPDGTAPDDTHATASNRIRNARAHLVNVHSGLCLGVAGGAREKNAALVQLPCKEDLSLLWKIVDMGNTAFITIRNLKSDLCATIAGGETGKNIGAVQYPCDGDPSRRWQLIQAPNRAVRFMNEHSGLCLTVAGGATAEELPAVQFPCDGDPSRDWEIRPVKSVNGDAPGHAAE